MFIDYISHLENLTRKCEDFKNAITSIFFKYGQKDIPTVNYYCDTQAYQSYISPIKQCVELCKLIKPRYFTPSDAMSVSKTIFALDDSSKVSKLSDFTVNYNVLKSILALVERVSQDTFSSYDSEERQRINEAMHGGLEGCNYSCVAMSVSAVESRLYKLMTRANPDVTGKLDKMTLGQLIAEYNADKDSYLDVVPDKHKPLLELCNTYRIFSVHPKKVEVSATIAISILNLSIAFLSDPDTAT